MASDLLENREDDVNSNRLPFVVRCPNFYEMEKKAKAIVYDDRELIEMIPIEDLRKGYKFMNIWQTNYDRVPLKNSGFPSFGGTIAGYHTTSIKFLARPGRGTNVFFFVYSSFGSKLEEYQTILKKHCEVLQHVEEFKVDGWNQVKLAGLYGLKSKVGKVFIRVRIIEINKNTMEIECWAVDEGFFAKCEPRDLIFLNDHCVSLEMLAVPGIFGSDPTPAQLAKFEEEKYCIAQVMQPKLNYDSAPRKVVLCSPK